MPNDEGNWMSLRPGVEFQLPYDDNDSRSDKNEDPLVSSRLRAARERLLMSTSSSNYYDSRFVDAHETYYADYAQAWRLLGLFIDCNPSEMAHQDYQRKLEEEEQQGDEQEDEQADDECYRYLLWAAVSVKILQ
jgi:hypothetical protein